MNETNANESNSTPATGTNQTTEARANIVIPKDVSFEVEEGLPDLPSGGRQGQSKYSPLVAQAKALKVNSKFKVQRHGVPAAAYTRNVRLAFKKANLTGVKVTAIKDEDAVWIYRTA